MYVNPIYYGKLPQSKPSSIRKQTLLICALTSIGFFGIVFAIESISNSHQALSAGRRGCLHVNGSAYAHSNGQPVMLLHQSTNKSH
jgi:hypothetical protein